MNDLARPAPDPAKAVKALYRDVWGYDIPEVEEQAIRQSKGSPVYGELPPASVTRMLAYMQLTPADVFYDLGSGTGKVVVQAAISAPLKKCVGVELSATRCREAKGVVRRAKREGLLAADSCVIREADLMTTRLSDATVIYTCSTAFSTRFLKKLAGRIVNECRRVRLFVSLQDVERRGLVHIDTLKLATSWNRRSPLHVYRVEPTGKSRGR